MEPDNQTNQPAPTNPAPQPVVPTPPPAPVSASAPLAPPPSNLPQPQQPPPQVAPMQPQQPTVAPPTAVTPQPETPQPIAQPQQQPMQQASFQQPPPPQPVGVPAAPAQQNQQFVPPSVGTTDIQDGMRKTILKIIGILTALSLVAVFLLFLISGATDSSLTETSQASNNQASYSIPTNWSVDNNESFDAYYNQQTLEGSQATLLVLNPVRISFDSDRVSDTEIQSVANEYRRAVNEGDGDLTMGEGAEANAEGFHMVFDFEVSGVAEDGVTEIRGLSRILFDDQNYAHTLEFVAIRSYWEANQTEIRGLFDSYTLKAGE